jgi:AraC family transcriptional regulator of adaptative response / DNA-3-methyladenine glycosylase II
VRRFNATFRDLYDRTPRELRRVRSRQGELIPDGFRFRLAYRPPFDWSRHLEYLAPRAIPGVEQAADGAYRRTFRVGEQPGVLEVRRAPDGGPALELRITPVEPEHLPALIERARRVFDLGADPEVIRGHLRRDPTLRPWVDRCSALRVPGAWNGFELAMRAIIGQQISVAAATTITGRVASRWGEPLDDGTHVVFPRPEALVDADLASIGVPRARGETLRRLARAVASGALSLEPGADPETVRETLLAIPGIGDWTAQYVALRALGEPDAFPASDLGLLRSPAAGDVKGPRELLERAEAWRPWRGYAAIVLWRAYGAAAAANATPRRRVVQKERTRAHSRSRSRTLEKREIGPSRVGAGRARAAGG